VVVTAAASPLDRGGAGAGAVAGAGVVTGACVIAGVVAGVIAGAVAGSVAVADAGGYGAKGEQGFVTTVICTFPSGGCV
jgi:hypothetical protein